MVAKEATATIVVQRAWYNGLLVPSCLAEDYVFLYGKYIVQYSTQLSILVYSVPATNTIASAVIYVTYVELLLNL